MPWWGWLLTGVVATALFGAIESELRQIKSTMKDIQNELESIRTELSEIRADLDSLETTVTKPERDAKWPNYGPLEK